MFFINNIQKLVLSELVQQITKRRFIFPFLFLITGIISFGCSPSPQKKADEAGKKICSILNGSLTINNLTEAANYYNSVITENPGFVNDNRFTDMMRTEYNQCFLNLGFRKKLAPDDSALIGNGSKYLSLDIDSTFMYISDIEGASFVIKLNLNGNKPLINFTEDKFDGAVDLLSENGENMMTIKMYATPDLISIIRNGTGKANITSMVGNCWQDITSNPFNDLLKMFYYIDKSVKYRLRIDFVEEDVQNRELIDRTDAFVK
jgi:hypothetical protein